MKLARNSRRIINIMLNISITYQVLLMFSATAATAQAYCIRPEVPPVHSKEAERLYRDEISQLYNLYFSDVQNYYLCLEQERDAMNVATKQAIEDYNAFLNRNPG